MRPDVAGSNPAPGTKNKQNSVTLDMVKTQPTSPQPEKNGIRLRYIRLPNRTMESLDELVFRSDKLIVARAKVTSVNSVTFDGRTVLEKGFPITYFEFPGRWYTVVKIRNLQGEFTGYYCDIVVPPRQVGGWVEITDLFLDLWVSPDLRYKVLDEDELEEALRKGWITKQLYVKARLELQKLIRRVEQGKFPPSLVKEFEARFSL